MSYKTGSDYPKVLDNVVLLSHISFKDQKWIVFVILGYYTMMIVIGGLTIFFLSFIFSLTFNFLEAFFLSSYGIIIGIIVYCVVFFIYYWFVQSQRTLNKKTLILFNLIIVSIFVLYTFIIMENTWFFKRMYLKEGKYFYYPLLALLLFIGLGMVVTFLLFSNLRSQKVRLDVSNQELTKIVKNIWFEIKDKLNLKDVRYGELKLVPSKTYLRREKIQLFSHHKELLMDIPIKKFEVNGLSIMEPNKPFYIAFMLLKASVPYMRIIKPSIIPKKFLFRISKKDEVVNCEELKHNLWDRLDQMNFTSDPVYKSIPGFHSLSTESQKIILRIDNRYTISSNKISGVKLLLYIVLILASVFSALSILIILVTLPPLEELDYQTGKNLIRQTYQIITALIVSTSVGIIILIDYLKRIKGTSNLVLSDQELRLQRNWRWFQEESSVRLDFVEDIGTGKVKYPKVKYFVSVKMWFAETPLVYYDDQETASTVVNQIKMLFKQLKQT